MSGRDFVLGIHQQLWGHQEFAPEVQAGRSDWSVEEFGCPLCRSVRWRHQCELQIDFNVILGVLYRLIIIFIRPQISQTAHEIRLYGQAVFASTQWCNNIGTQTQHVEILSHFDNANLVYCGLNVETLHQWVRDKKRVLSLARFVKHYFTMLS